MDLCSKCGYPFTGTDSQKASFVAQQILKVGKIDDAKESVKTAKRVLLIIGGINILYAMFSGDVGTILVGGIIGVAFIVFGIVVQRSPFIFLVIPLAFLVAFYLIDGLVDPMNLVRGIGMKIAFIISLSYAIVRVKRAENIRRESQYLSGK